MTSAGVRHAWIAALFTAACGAPAQQPHVGPALGESTAPGPTFGDAPAPDPGGPKEVSARVHGQLTPTPNPVIVVDTMPSTTTGTQTNQPASGTDNATFYAPGVVVPAGANGPGTGNGRATSTTTQPGTTQIPTASNPPATTPSPTTPVTPTPSPATPQPIQPAPITPPLNPAPVAPPAPQIPVSPR